MQVNLVSVLKAFAIITFTASVASAQDEFDYTKLITKDGAVEGATEIDLDEAHKLHGQGVLFIDVNSPRRYRFAHIPGAVGLDFRTTLTKETLAEHAAKDQTIVFYCPHEGCYGAAQAAAKAVTWGYTEVLTFEGGADAWSAAGYPIEGE